MAGVLVADLLCCGVQDVGEGGWRVGADALEQLVAAGEDLVDEDAVVLQTGSRHEGFTFREISGIAERFA
ncbi:hypothetical protein [Streptomyces milbemycinicus]|uniref:hypothetical protein n=1 Tax=Streptomyces milbemycinicus TaxID=476552 RepID=UPI0021F83DE7|nr:hypothetical protein [Streptomyces milbemycinicus]